MLLENWVIFTSSIILSFYFLLLGLLQCAVAISPSLFCFFFFELFKMALSFSLCSDRLTSHVGSVPAVCVTQLL